MYPQEVLVKDNPDMKDGKISAGQIRTVDKSRFAELITTLPTEIKVQVEE